MIYSSVIQPLFQEIYRSHCHTENRTLGRFYNLCDEANELDWAVALQQLIELLQDDLKTNKRNKSTITIVCVFTKLHQSLPA